MGAGNQGLRVAEGQAQQHQGGFRIKGRVCGCSEHHLHHLECWPLLHPCTAGWTSHAAAHRCRVRRAERRAERPCLVAAEAYRLEGGGQCQGWSTGKARAFGRTREKVWTGKSRGCGGQKWETVAIQCMYDCLWPKLVPSVGLVRECKDRSSRLVGEDFCSSGHKWGARPQTSQRNRCARPRVLPTQHASGLSQWRQVVAQSRPNTLLRQPVVRPPQPKLQSAIAAFALHFRHATPSCSAQWHLGCTLVKRSSLTAAYGD